MILQKLARFSTNILCNVLPFFYEVVILEKSMSQGVIPIYQKLTFHEIPQICFAHRYSTTCYDFRFSAAPHKMELTFFEKGDVVKMWEDGAQQHIAEGTFQFATFDRPFRVYSQASACSHTTVGFKAAYHLTTISREELLACNRLDAERPLWVFLPSEGFRPQGSNPMEQLLRRLDHTFCRAGSSPKPA